MNRILRDIGVCCLCVNKKCRNENHFHVGDFVRDNETEMAAADAGTIGRRIFTSVGRIIGVDSANLGTCIEVQYDRTLAIPDFHGPNQIDHKVKVRRGQLEIERVSNAEALIFMLEK